MFILDLVTSVDKNKALNGLRCQLSMDNITNIMHVHGIYAWIIVIFSKSNVIYLPKDTTVIIGLSNGAKIYVV